MAFVLAENHSHFEINRVGIGKELVAIGTDFFKVVDVFPVLAC